MTTSAFGASAAATLSNSLVAEVEQKALDRVLHRFLLGRLRKRR